MDCIIYCIQLLLRLIKNNFMIIQLMSKKTLLSEIVMFACVLLMSKLTLALN